MCETRPRLECRVIEQSGFGATAECSERDFSFLCGNRHLWEEETRLRVSTHLNELPACINGLIDNSDGKFYISIKLLDGLNWLSSNF